MKRGHQPLRTCRACGKKAQKAELVRWVIARNRLVEDLRQDMNGRGIYSCPISECRQGLLKNKKIMKMIFRLKNA